MNTYRITYMQDRDMASLDCNQEEIIEAVMTILGFDNCLLISVKLMPTHIG